MQDNKGHSPFDKLFEDFAANDTTGNFENAPFRSNIRALWNFEFNSWLVDTKLCKENDYLKYYSVAIFNEFVEARYPHVRTYYAIPFNNIVNTFGNDESGKREFAKSVKRLNDLSFQNEIKVLSPGKIVEKLEFHLRSFLRNGGEQADWIKHTKVLMPANITPEQKDVFLTWIESKEDNITIQNHPIITTLKTILTTDELKKLHKQLNEKYIKEISENDFNYWLSGKPIINGMKKIYWKGAKGHAIQLFKAICVNFGFPMLNKCVQHRAKKPFDSNDYKGESNEIGLIAGTFRPKKAI